MFLQKKCQKIWSCQKKAVLLHPLFRKAMARSRAVVARQAHNLKVGGSIPPSATKKERHSLECLFSFVYRSCVEIISKPSSSHLLIVFEPFSNHLRAVFESLP